MIEPSLTAKFGHYYLLWFERSNTYSCIDRVFYEHLQVWLESNSKSAFATKLQARYDLELELAEWQYDRVQSYLNSCKGAISETPRPSKIPEVPTTLPHAHSYLLGHSSIAIQFSHDSLRNMLHPLIAHLEVPTTSQPALALGIYLNHDKIYLSNPSELTRSFAVEEYHKLQGQVLMQLINAQHQKEEKDWLGLLHASAVAKNEQALLLFGPSGSGKSTLTALLAAHGFELLADDLVPILAADKKLYQNPAAVNIKSESFQFLEPYWPEAKTYSDRLFSKGKSPSRYIPMHTHLGSKGYACRHLIKVRYQKDSAASLVALDFKEGLETLIPEAWLHPQERNAKAFLQWLGTVQFFELTYSDFQEVLPLLEQLTT